MLTLISVAILFVLAAIIIYFIILYNGLINVANNIDKAWANIDVLLKQRYDEIPKLISVCESYMKYEKATLENIVSLRNTALGNNDMQEIAGLNNQMQRSLSGLFALAENYPELKANETFNQLAQRISYLESQIADRREYYNDSVNQYNIRIQELPDLFIANMLKLQSRTYFKVEEQDKQDVAIKFNMP